MIEEMIEISIKLRKEDGYLYAEVTTEEQAETLQSPVEYDFSFTRDLSEYVEKAIVRWIEGQEI